MSSGKRSIAVLGATGSVGQTALKVLRQNQGSLCLEMLMVHRNWRDAIALIEEFNPPLIAVVEKESADRLREHVATTSDVTWLVGDDAHTWHLCVSSQCSIVAAVAGSIGLSYIALALARGLRVLVANKEPLVMAGAQLMQLAQNNGGELVPVDSEHSALRQCLMGVQSIAQVQTATITASGGPFLHRSDLHGVKVAEAIAHPVWSMGAKISVDSATMMNKALELVEASVLFGLSADQLDVVVHPAGVMHAMVQFKDGAVMAHLSTPDMQVPLAAAMCGQGTLKTAVNPLSLTELTEAKQLEFMPVPTHLQPALDLAYEAVRSETNVLSIAMNAANEVAVDCFLQEQLQFDAIVPTVERACRVFSDEAQPVDIDSILDLHGRVSDDTRAYLTTDYQAVL